MQLRMCRNYGWIHKLEELQSIPKHAHIRKHTQRGVICQARPWNAAIWENTSLSKQSLTRQSLVPRPEPPDQSSSHLGERRGEEAKERREGRASDQTRRDRGREKHAEGARNEAREEENNVRGGLRMRVLRESGGREERWKTERQLGKYWAGGEVKVKRDENGERTRLQDKKDNFTVH